jgi:hypothetical protein
MSASTNLVDKLEGVENSCAWKYRIGLILEENDLEKFIKENVPEPEEEASKAKLQETPPPLYFRVRNRMVRRNGFGIASKRRRSYRTMFLERETSYGTTGGISGPYCACTAGFPRLLKTN